MTALLRIRRGVGWLFVLCGLIHAGNMVFASLYSLRRLSIHVTPQAWTRLHYGHFLLLVCASLLYLTLSFRREKLFYYETLADFLAGVGAFVLIMTATAALLVTGKVTPWISLIPSAFQLAYGAGLIAGRPLAFLRRKAEDDDK